MRTIERQIVGGFIFSRDNKLLLGRNRSGGAYEDFLVVPGGGIEPGETELQALQREMLEETGIDTSTAETTFLGKSTGEHEKTLQSTGERVLVKMQFADYKIQLAQLAAQVELKTDDDWCQPQWWNLGELTGQKIGPATFETLVKAGFITS